MFQVGASFLLFCALMSFGASEALARGQIMRARVSPKYLLVNSAKVPIPKRLPPARELAAEAEPTKLKKSVVVPGQYRK